MWQNILRLFNVTDGFYGIEVIHGNLSLELHYHRVNVIVTRNVALLYVKSYLSDGEK